jgi:hypothetical protein
MLLLLWSLLENVLHDIVTILAVAKPHYIIHELVEDVNGLIFNKSVLAYLFIKAASNLLYFIIY